MSLIQEALEKIGKARIEEQAKPRQEVKVPAPVTSNPITLPTSEPVAGTQPVVELKVEEKLTQLSDENLIRKKTHALNQPFYLKMTILGVLSLVLIATFLMLQFLMPRIEESSQKRAVVSVKPTPAAVPKAEKKETFSFIPKFSRSTPSELFNLSGITVSGGQPLALINNQVVGVGDALKENAVVKDIQASKVILDYQGRDLVLSMR